MSPEKFSDDLKVATRVAVELFDHSYRVKQYLTRIGPGESKEHERLVETLVRLLKSVEGKTISSFEALLDTPLQDDSRDHAVEVLQDNLRRFSRYFTTIHELLANLPRESIGPEIVFTLEGCFPESYRPPGVSVVLGSIVNAFEFDFIEILEETLGDIGDVVSADERAFVLQLAICHADSPLAYRRSSVMRLGMQSTSSTAYRARLSASSSPILILTRTSGKYWRIGLTSCARTW